MDYPRFERIEGPQDRLHLAYNGGRDVELVLKIADLIEVGRRRRTTLLAATRPESSLFGAPAASPRPENA
jgi:hypothetical protein